MNTNQLLKTYDNGQLSRNEIADILGRTCSTYYLAGAYIETRDQRDECRRQAYTNEAETTLTHSTHETQFIEILAAYDEHRASYTETLDALRQKCSPSLLAGVYLTCRGQLYTNEGKIRANRAKTPETHLANSTVMDLIGYAYTTNNISRASAYTMLAAIGYGGDIAETYLEELLDTKFPLAVRETYLADPENAMLFCTRCGIKVDANLLSTNSLCIECSSAAVEQNLIELEAKEGPYYRRWRERMLDYAFTLAREVLDDVATRETSIEGDMLDYVPHTDYPDDETPF